MSAKTALRLGLAGLLAGFVLVLVIPVLLAFAVGPATFLLKWGSPGPATGQFINPAGLAVDNTNSFLYVADSGNNRIQKFALNGTFVSTFGISGTANGELRSPAAVAVDNSGNLYVAEADNNRVQKFTSAGAFSQYIGTGGVISGTAPGEFNSPSGIAVDRSAGHVYVADSANNRIQKFKLDGTAVISWGVAGSAGGEFNHPVGLAVDESTSYIYVADSYNDRIQVFDSDGNLIRTWGSSGTSIGQFTRPTGVAISGTHVLVADSANNRVQVFAASTGLYETQWGDYGSADGQFLSIGGIAVDSSGYIYLADPGNSRIDKYGPLPPTPNVAANPLPFMAIFGSPGFQSPEGIAVTGTLLFVADQGCDCIYRYDAHGSTPALQGSFGTGQLVDPIDVAAGPKDRVYVADSSGVKVFDTTGKYLNLSQTTAYPPRKLAVSRPGDVYVALNATTVPIVKFDGDLKPLTFSVNPDLFARVSIAGIEVNTAGTVYVSDATGKRVIRLDSSGATLGQFGSPGTAPGLFTNPAGLGADTAGNIFVTDTTLRWVQEFDSSDAYASTFNDASLGSNGPFNTPNDVAIDALDNVYILDRAAKRAIKFGGTRPTQFLLSFGEYGSGPGQFNRPAGIAVDNSMAEISAASSSYVFVADSLNARVQRFSTSGVYQLAWGPYPGTDNGLFLMPAGVAYCSSLDRVYVSDNVVRRIQYFDHNGAYKGKWGSEGKGAGQFDRPIGVAVNANCTRVFVADTGNNRIQVFNNTGGYISSIGPAIPGSSKPLLRPSGVAVDALGNLYVADTGNCRILRFTPGPGNGYTLWGEKGSIGQGLDNFSAPTGISTGGGFLLVSDTGNDRVMEYTISLIRIGKVGNSGTMPKLFNNVTGIATTGDGYVWVTDTGNNKGQLYVGIYLCWIPAIRKNN